LLADEPLAALDAPRRAEILAMFETIVTEFDIPMLYVTHSAAEAARLAHRVYLLKEGRVSAQGAAQDVLMQMGPSGPDQELGSFVSAQVELCDPDGLTQLDAGGTKLYIAKPYSVGARVLLRIAAHDVMIATQTVAGVSALNIIEGVVAEIHETDRAHATVGIQTAAGLIWSRVTQRSVARLGLRVGLGCHAVIKSVAVAQDNL
jgi:molybdate transport system ATP-binding protein